MTIWGKEGGETLHQFMWSLHLILSYPLKVVGSAHRSQHTHSQDHSQISSS